MTPISGFIGTSRERRLGRSRRNPTVPRGLRYADGVIDPARERMIWVREDHTTGAPEPVNTLVEIPLDGSTQPRVLQSGRDFYAAPRLSPDGRSSLGSNGSHPNMPWIGCELWVAEFAADGSIGRKKLIAGGDDELIFQPEWSPDGALYFVSDRAQPSLDGRWWNLFRSARRRHGRISRRSSRSFRWPRSSGERSGSSACPPLILLPPANLSAVMRTPEFTG